MSCCFVFSMSCCFNLLVLNPKVRKKSTGVSTRPQKFVTLNVNKGLDLSGCPKPVWTELAGVKSDWSAHSEALKAAVQTDIGKLLFGDKLTTLSAEALEKVIATSIQEQFKDMYPKI